MKITKQSKKIKDILAKLGEPYSIKVIDLENCIYRDLHNGYDIEVSGLDNRKMNFNASIYVWKTIDGTRIVDTVTNIESFDAFKESLTKMVSKYSSM